MACSRRTKSKQQITLIRLFKFLKTTQKQERLQTAQATTAAQEKTSDTTRNANNLAREAIAEIEKRKKCRFRREL